MMASAYSYSRNKKLILGIAFDLVVFFLGRLEISILFSLGHTVVLESDQSRSIIVSHDFP
jgi:hypothetical protein